MFFANAPMEKPAPSVGDDLIKKGLQAVSDFFSETVNPSVNPAVFAAGDLRAQPGTQTLDQSEKISPLGFLLIGAVLVVLGWFALKG